MRMRASAIITQVSEDSGHGLCVLALARPTFDVPYAEEMAAKAFARIDEAGLATVGPRGLLFDAAAAREAAEALKGRGSMGSCCCRSPSPTPR